MCTTHASILRNYMEIKPGGRAKRGTAPHVNLTPAAHRASQKVLWLNKWLPRLGSMRCSAIAHQDPLVS